MTCIRFESPNAPCRCSSVLRCACCGVELHHAHHRAMGTCESATCEYYLIGVKAERKRIAATLDAMAKDADEAAERDSRQPYDRNGVDAGYAHRLEELAKSLRGEP